MRLWPRIRAIERREGEVGLCRCTLDIVRAGVDPEPTKPLARCARCGGVPMRVLVRRADPGIKYAPERW